MGNEKYCAVAITICASQTFSPLESPYFVSLCQFLGSVFAKMCLRLITVIHACKCMVPIITFWQVCWPI